MPVTEETDSALRAAAMAHVQQLSAIHDPLTAEHLRAGFRLRGERVPLINPQRGIFKPQLMQHLLSIRTVFPKAGGKIWYDDQRQVHQQIYAGQESVDYAFIGDNPEAAENRWLRDAAERQVPVIHFLGIAPGRYQAIAPVFISGWNAAALKPKWCSLRGAT